MYVWFFELHGMGIHVQIVVADTEQEARSYLQFQDTTWVLSGKYNNQRGYINTILE